MSIILSLLTVEASLAIIIASMVYLSPTYRGRFVSILRRLADKISPPQEESIDWENPDPYMGCDTCGDEPESIPEREFMHQSGLCYHCQDTLSEAH